MIRAIVWLIVVAIGLVLVIFAATNHHWTQVDFWPSDITLRVPAVALLFVGLAVGFLVGLFVSWVAGGRTRREARRQRREVRRLTARLDREAQGQDQVRGQAPAVTGPGTSGPADAASPARRR